MKKEGRFPAGGLSIEEIKEGGYGPVMLSRQWSAERAEQRGQIKVRYVSRKEFTCKRMSGT